MTGTAPAWGDPIFAYCERGADASFWAEPLNAVSNAAFVVAALLALLRWSQAPARRSSDLGLIGLAAAIGIGSFLFHTVATRWARLADVVPIAAFMFASLTLALYRILGWRGGWIAGALVAFAAAGAAMGTIRCAGGAPCLSGSLGYIPALVALVAVGLAGRERPGGRLLLAAAAVFALSLVMRTLDQPLCAVMRMQLNAWPGTHMLWHLLNAGVIHLLLRALIDTSEKKSNN